MATRAGPRVAHAPDTDDLATVRIFLFVLTAIFVVLPFLPTDVEGEQVTLIGCLHLVAAVAWFALAYASMGDLVDVLEPMVADPLGAALVVLSWVALVSLVALAADEESCGGRARSWSGLARPRRPPLDGEAS